jgi:uncharacterized YigZ family protein
LFTCLFYALISAPIFKTGKQMKEQDTYMTIQEPCEGTFKDKGSKFICYLFPVSTEEQAKEHLLRIKKEHFSARHHCFAWRLTPDGSAYRSNDDGEPSGTAGRPILGQLLSNELTNIQAVVVRYFGGTLLGVSGLINAYKSATADAISNAKIIEKIVEKTFEVVFSYPVQNQVMKVMKEEQIEIENMDFGIDCRLRIKVRLNKTEQISSKIEKIEGATLSEIS